MQMKIECSEIRWNTVKCISVNIKWGFEITHLPVIGVRGARVGGAGQPILQLPAILLIHQAASQPVH